MAPPSAKPLAARCGFLGPDRRMSHVLYEVHSQLEKWLRETTNMSKEDVQIHKIHSEFITPC
jgi:hypothetical protein